MFNDTVGGKPLTLFSYSTRLFLLLYGHVSTSRAPAKVRIHPCYFRIER